MASGYGIPNIGLGPVTDKSVAETFEEPGVSVSNSSSTVFAGSIKLQGSGFEYDLNDGSVTDKQELGVVIKPDKKLIGIDVTTDASLNNLGGSGQLRVKNLSTGEIIHSESAGDGEDTHVVGKVLEQGTEYAVYVYQENGNYADSDYYSQSFDEKDEGPFDVTEGWINGSKIATRAYAITSILHRPESGSARVSWEQPRSVYRWDKAAFQTDPDGETVFVYVEENDGTGWQEVAGPINRGDNIPASPDSEVRFRIELSRDDAVNNPRLTSAHRRWVV